MSQEIILAIGKQSYPDLREGKKQRQKKKLYHLGLNIRDVGYLNILENAFRAGTYSK